MPLTVSTSCGCSPSSESAIFSAVKTPKSPHPGHQSGSALPLNSFTGNDGRLGLRSTGMEVSTRSSPICRPPLDPDLVNRDVLARLAGEDFLDAVDDVVRQEQRSGATPGCGRRADGRARKQGDAEAAAVIVFDEAGPRRIDGDPD